MPGDAINGLDPDAVALAKAMHSPLVRFGGNFTSSLDVVSTLSQDGRRLTVFCVNRSLETDIASTIRLQHFDPRRAAKVHLLSSASINDVNDEINPENVGPVDSTETIPSSGWAHVFPHESDTVIEVDRK